MGSELFPYCHNDPIDLTDPMGLEEKREPWYNHQEQAKALDREYGLIMAYAQWNNSGAIAAGMSGQQLYQQARQEVQKISEGKKAVPVK